MAVISYAPLSIEQWAQRRRYFHGEYDKRPEPRHAKQKQTAQRVEAPAVPKGHCSKCGAHIGRGVKFHEKHCAGSGEG